MYLMVDHLRYVIKHDSSKRQELRRERVRRITYNPSEKNLVASVISELTFKIQDSEGKAIDNRGLPVILSIRIK